MQLLGKRSLAWVLKWVNDAAILFFAVILLVTLPLAVSLAFRSSYVVPDFPLFSPGLSIQGVEPTSADKEVIQVVAKEAGIAFRTQRDLPSIALSVSGLAVWFGAMIWILWLLRMVLVSLVAKQPLTAANARRFRSIGLLLVSLGVWTALWELLVTAYLRSHFELPPSPGYLALFFSHFPFSSLFTGLLILLMAEVMRIGAEHRLDSEAVI